ncbi:ABC transporter substrate-binding protein [Brevibacterium oceani]|uniref:ABC transporter substrate-binding protein n=1 Tax=Brevibacterium oceani TaxID=358099 RepID=UPI0015E62F68|nr:ABC transporter substrate-binding protein [Brevibacterium oceani]
MNTPNRRQALGAGLAVSAVAGLSACGGGTVGAADAGDPVKGGTLRAGVTGGNSADTVDAHIPVNSGDIARTVNLYNCLLTRTDDYKIQPELAESFEPNSDSTVWTATLREGIKFSDGRDITPDDVVFTFERINDPDDPKTASSSFTMLEKVVATGDRTVEFRLNEPNGLLNDSVSEYTCGIVPADYDPKKPVSSGPFKLKSHTPGQSTVMERNEYYWRNSTYLDEVQVLNFNDSDALINALLSSQVDAIAQIPLALVEVIDADERMAILNSKTGMWLPFTMRVDKKPFDDVKVRQAFRLVVDRKQMIEQVLSGYGTIGNDMFGPLSENYPDFPQRDQDIDKAKKLLAEAGYPDGLEVELVTAPIQSGVVEAAQVFAQQAADAGITVKIRKVDATTFFGDEYLKWDFAQDFWYTRDFLPQCVSCAMDVSPFNETHWVDKKFSSIVQKARGIPESSKRKNLEHEAQKMLYDEGGYIIWGFANQVDAYQKYVGGLKENATGRPLGGWRLDRVWIGEV